MWMFRGVLMNVFVKLKPWWDRSQEQQPDRDLRSERTATVQCLRTHSAVLDRAPRLPAAVPGGPRLPEARGAALVHPLPGRAEPAGGRLGRRLSASRRIGRRALEGRGSPQARPSGRSVPPRGPVCSWGWPRPSAGLCSCFLAHKLKTLPGSLIPQRLQFSQNLRSVTLACICSVSVLPQIDQVTSVTSRPFPGEAARPLRAAPGRPRS